MPFVPSSCLPSFCHLLMLFLYLLFCPLDDLFDPSLTNEYWTLSKIIAPYSLWPLLSSSNAPFLFVLFLPSFEIIYIFHVCALFPFDLPVIFECFIFHTVCPHSVLLPLWNLSDQLSWKLYFALSLEGLIYLPSLCPHVCFWCASSMSFSLQI